MCVHFLSYCWSWSLTLLNSNDTDYFCVMHVQDDGLFSQAKGRPERIRVPCLDSYHDKLLQLRQDFRLHDKTQMMVLLSLRTKDMNKYFSMFPEVWFVDCTAGMFLISIVFSNFVLCMLSYTSLLRSRN